jgi:hypothetical protein
MMCAIVPRSGRNGRKKRASAGHARNARADLVALRTATRRWWVEPDEEGLPVIPGRRGCVSAHDLWTLCVHVTARRRVMSLLRKLRPRWRRHQVGDAEVNLLVPLEDLDAACRTIRAYRRRRLSESHKTRLVAAGRQFVRRRHESTERLSSQEGEISNRTE